MLQIAGYLFPLITIPYLARVIGASGFGKIAFATAVITWFMSIVTWGFNYTATRDVARHRNNPEEVSVIFSNIISTRMFLALLCFIVLVGLTYVIPEFKENRFILILTYLMIPGNILFPDWMFQALEKMKYITILSVLAKLFFTVAVFLFIKKPDDYLLQPLFSSLGCVLCGLISLYIILFKWGYKIYFTSFSTIVKTIRDGADVFINNFTPNLYNSMSIILLGMFHVSSANGIMSAGTKSLSILQQFMDVMSRTFFPFLSRRIDKHEIYVKISVTIAGIASLGLILIAPLFIKFFYTEEFYDGIIVAIILAPSIFFLAVSDSFGTNYLILVGEEKRLRNITMTFSVVGFLMGIPLIYFFSYYGAAITIVVTRGLLALFTYINAKRVKSRKSINLRTSF